MPDYKTKFSESWLSLVDGSGEKVGEWCRKKDDYTVHCIVCKADIKCSNSGKQQVLQHAKNKKHLDLCKNFNDNSQSQLNFPAKSKAGSSKPIINICQATQDSQIKWMLKMATCNFSFRSCDHIGDLFQHMLFDSKVAKGFSLSHSSASYFIGKYH